MIHWVVFFVSDFAMVALSSGHITRQSDFSIQNQIVLLIFSVSVLNVATNNTLSIN